MPFHNIHQHYLTVNKTVLDAIHGILSELGNAGSQYDELYKKLGALIIYAESPKMPLAELRKEIKLQLDLLKGINKAVYNRVVLELEKVVVHGTTEKLLVKSEISDTCQQFETVKESLSLDKLKLMCAGDVGVYFYSRLHHERDGRALTDFEQYVFLQLIVSFRQVCVQCN